MNPSDNELEDDLRDEYDFATMQGGVRGKYAKQYHEGAKLIMLDEDVAKFFSTSESVNKALRAILAAAPRQEAARL
jgi:hypothetical protein